MTLVTFLVSLLAFPRGSARCQLPRSGSIQVRPASSLAAVPEATRRHGSGAAGKGNGWLGWECGRDGWFCACHLSGALLG